MRFRQLGNFGLILIILYFSQQALSASYIRGSIRDKNTNEPLTGAAILIEGTSLGTTADIDGNFELKVEPGTYNLVTSYVSYQSKKIANIQVTKKTDTTLHLQMEEATLKLQGIQVVARMKTDTDLSMIRSVRTAIQVVNGVSSQQIGRTLDKDASEVVKRIPGITILENRFVVVRGLNQRYNHVWLNNMTTPSSETDVKAFSFDAVPSQMIDHILIYKTGSAENAAEATGGFIKIATKNIPDENFFHLDYGIGYNDATTFRKVQFLPLKGIDLIGLGALSRDLPTSFPANLSNLSQSDKDQAGLLLPTNWVTKPTITLPNQKVSFTYGKKWQYESGTRLGHMTSVNYNHAYSVVENMLNYMYERFDITNEIPVFLNKYSTDRFTRNFQIGVLNNWAYQNTTGTLIEFKNLLNQMSIDKSTFTEGWNNYRMSNFQYFNNQFNSRTTYTGQISGKHQIHNQENHQIDWLTGYSYANRLEPDRQNRSKKEVSPGTFQYVLPDVPSINELGRLYTTNHEHIITAALNWKKEFNLSQFTVSMKTGTYNEFKTRNFKERSITYQNAYGRINTNEINQLHFDSIFTSPYLGHGKVLQIEEQTNVANMYTAQQFLSALYIIAVVPIGNLNINGGLRAEFNRLMLQGYYNMSSPVNIDNPELNIFPSINTSYQITEKNLVRFAYSKSINRPEFREMAPLTYYDFSEKNSLIGNPELKTATIHNVDLRLEHYPSPSETYSLATFYKKFNHPIEMVSVGAGSLFSYENAVEADNFGLEIEVKKSLINKNQHQLSTNLNATWIKSKVEFKNNETESNRPLQGQSPYVINIGLYYQNLPLGIAAAANYHIMGKRILVSAQLNQGIVEVPDVYELPRHVLDFSLKKRITPQIELKFGIKDILAQYHTTQQTFDYVNNGMLESATLVNKHFNTGRTWSLGVQFSL